MDREYLFYFKDIFCNRNFVEDEVFKNLFLV